MLPIRTSSIFRSRWMALLWAGGIIWSAVEFAGGQTADKAAGNSASAGSDSASAEAQAAEMKRAEQLLQQFGK